MYVRVATTYPVLLVQVISASHVVIRIYSLSMFSTVTRAVLIVLMLTTISPRLEQFVSTQLNQVLLYGSLICTTAITDFFL